MACIYIEEFCSFFFFLSIIFLAIFKDWFLYYVPKIYKSVLEMGAQFFTFIKMYSICQFKSGDAFYVYWQVNLDSFEWLDCPILISCCCSITKSCLTLCDPMDCSTPGFPALHHLLEFAKTHVHWVGDVIQTSRPLLFPSPSAFYLSPHQGLF